MPVEPLLNNEIAHNANGHGANGAGEQGGRGAGENGAFGAVKSTAATLAGAEAAPTDDDDLPEWLRDDPVEQAE